MRQYQTKVGYHFRKEVKELLNIQKPNRMDWRDVTARMDVRPSSIEKIEKDFKEDPTQKLFKLYNLFRFYIEWIDTMY